MEVLRGVQALKLWGQPIVGPKEPQLNSIFVCIFSLGQVLYVLYEIVLLYATAATK